jgi:hypothetical protein
MQSWTSGQSFTQFSASDTQLDSQTVSKTVQTSDTQFRRQIHSSTVRQSVRQFRRQIHSSTVRQIVTQFRQSFSQALSIQQMFIPFLLYLLYHGGEISISGIKLKMDAGQYYVHMFECMSEVMYVCMYIISIYLFMYLSVHPSISIQSYRKSESDRKARLCVKIFQLALRATKMYYHR